MLTFANILAHVNANKLLTNADILAHVNANKLLTNDYISKRIRELQQEGADRLFVANFFVN